MLGCTQPPHAISTQGSSPVPWSMWLSAGFHVELKHWVLKAYLRVRPRAYVGSERRGDIKTCTGQRDRNVPWGGKRELTSGVRLHGRDCSPSTPVWEVQKDATIMPPRFFFWRVTLCTLWRTSLATAVWARGWPGGWEAVPRVARE